MDNQRSDQETVSWDIRLDLLGGAGQYVLCSPTSAESLSDVVHMLARDDVKFHGEIHISAKRTCKMG